MQSKFQFLQYDFILLVLHMQQRLC